MAIAVFVPTPSVELTRTGSRMPGGRAIAEANPPSPPMTSGRRVAATEARISSTARSPASISTPELRYASQAPPCLAPGTAPLRPRPSLMKLASGHGPGLAQRHRLSDGVLQNELVAGRVVRDRDRILPVKTGEAEAVIWQIQPLQHARNREVAERVGTEELADLLDRMGGRDQFCLDLGVDAVEAWMVDWRRTDAEVNLSCTGLAKQRHDLAGGRATDDRIVHNDQPFAGHDLAQRAQLDGHATLAHGLGGLNEGAARVAVTDHALAIWQPRALGIAGGRGCPRVRHRHHDICLNGRLGGKRQAHPAPRFVEVAAHHV